MQAPNPKIIKLMRRAIAIAGSQSELARQLGIKPPSVNRMLHRGRVSPTTAIKLEKAVGIERAQWRPDLYA